jgi:hypothetical protein
MLKEGLLLTKIRTAQNIELLGDMGRGSRSYCWCSHPFTASVFCLVAKAWSVSRRDGTVEELTLPELPKPVTTAEHLESLPPVAPWTPNEINEECMLLY